MVKALGMLFIFPFNFLLVGHQPQRFMGLFLQILFGANPAIKPIYLLIFDGSILQNLDKFIGPNL